MKTKFYKIFGFAMLGAISLSSCDSFLDMQDTEQMTYDKIWEKKTYVEGFVMKCYNGLPDNLYPPTVLENGASDEISSAWVPTGYGFVAHNNGTWSVSSPADDPMPGSYALIRHCTIALRDLDRCLTTPNRDPQISEEEVSRWKAEIRYLRAYYYYRVMLTHGAVPIYGESLADPMGSMDENALPRTPWDDCVKFVTDELMRAADSLPARQISEMNYGRPTSVMCQFLSARLALYSARPLFNGNAMYKNLYELPDGTGKRLFSDADANKWVVAADMLKEAIDSALSVGHKLYEDPTGNPYKSVRGVFDVKWNDELIWARRQTRGGLQSHCKPFGFGATGGAAYGGYAPLQRHVDQYAMQNGYCPIKGYNASGAPLIDTRATGYDETAVTSWKSFSNPAHIKANRPQGVVGGGDTYGAGVAKSTYGMYVNREPRFYINIMWNDSRWLQSPYKNVYFHTGQADPNPDNVMSGPSQGHSHPWTGYMIIKGLDITGQQGVKETPNEITWPYMRLAELYLSYAEALNEINPSDPNILLYLNKIRARAGIPAIGSDEANGEVYSDIIGNQDLQRDAIIREREVELAFEQQRYNDMRTLMLARSTNNGPVYGMNKRARDSKPEGEFWKRTAIQNRVFLNKHYLFPFRQDVLDRNKKITQNYGW